jgi:hypothetical protein
MRGRRSGGRRERSKEEAKNVRLRLMRWIEKIEIPLLAPSLKVLLQKFHTCIRLARFHGVRKAL